MDQILLNSTADVFKKEYVIKADQADENGRVTCGTLARLMQDATTAHMASLGIGVDTLMEKDLLWVIVCTQINITRLPKRGETIEQYTWAGAEKFGMHTRRYAFFSKEGEELLQAASLFLLVNKESRTLSEAEKETVNLPLVEIAGEPKLPKMMQKFPSLMFSKTHEVSASEIDYNEHVNNAVYLEWADTIFDPEFTEEQEIKEYWIQYDQEIVLGQKVEMKYASADNCAYLKGYVEGTECFKMKIDF
ncbi:MAG: hypothetical protein IKG39_10845 [Lachnospiraceae bacterium]|nr:hypothetical protein [Lachnospiraceae bacterium]